jgi:ribosomal protein L21E
MKVKKYSDDTFNIHYEVGDYVKIKHNPKFGDPDEAEEKWGKVIKVVGKPLTAKLVIEVDDEVQSFAWNVKPTDKDGNILSKEDILKQGKVVEMIQVDLSPINESNKKIIKFTDI